MGYTYPASLFDDPENLLGQLGTFWQQLYQSRNMVWSLCRGKAEMERQTNQDLLETADTYSRERCPVYHTALWHPLVLREDQQTPGHPILYGDGAVYGVQPSGGAVYTFGGGVDSSVAWRLEDAGAANLKTCRVVTSGIAAPQVVLTEGVDFSIDLATQTIIFRDDPFQDPRLLQEAADDGVLTVTLWAFRGGFEESFIYNQYGYAIGLEAPSSANYRQLVDAVLDGLATGPSREILERAFSAMTDVPLAKGNETVLEVTQDNRYLWVLTDQNAYRLKKTSTVLVVVDDELIAGQRLCDTVKVDMPNGAIPAGLTSLSLPADFLAGVTSGALTFSNASTALTVTEGVSGKIKLSWALGGDAADVAAFFTKMHDKGVTAGKTLANYLDIRPQPQATEPTADNLPTTVNPLELLFENVFRGNLFLVRVRTSQLGPDALGLDYQWALRKILPPHLAMIVVTS